jgi:hypothetical protein
LEHARASRKCGRACKDAHTLFTSQREIKREIERERERGRERERERESEKEGERDRLNF